MRRTCSSNIVEVCDVRHAVCVLEGIDFGLRPVFEDIIKVRNHCLNVGRAVLWHGLADWLKVSPEVATKRCKKCELSRLTKVNPTYTMFCTVAEDAYPAQKGPGLLLKNESLCSRKGNQVNADLLDHGETRQRACNWTSGRWP